jgi:FkbM family methyltransferase
MKDLNSTNKIMPEKMKYILKKFIRPYLIPIARIYIRHMPFKSGKKKYWDWIVAPYLRFGSYTSVATTVFNKKIKCNTSDLIQNYVYYFGIWEPNLTNYVKSNLHAGATFIDVGANVGYFSLLASGIVEDSGRVVSIEAHPHVFEALKNNLNLNHCKNVRAINVAAADRRCMLNIFTAASGQLCHSTIFETEGYHSDFAIQGMPLSDILSDEEKATATMLKIDVEGAEWTVLKGMYPILECCRDELEIFMEISPERLAQQGKKADDILETMKEFRFNCYTLENHYSPDAYLPPYKLSRPLRLEGNINVQMDVVFSRRDSDIL